MDFLGFAVVLTRASVAKIPNPPCHLVRVLSSWSLRMHSACFKNDVQLLHDGISSGWFTSKLASLIV